MKGGLERAAQLWHGFVDAWGEPSQSKRHSVAAPGAAMQLQSDDERLALIASSLAVYDAAFGAHHQQHEHHGDVDSRSSSSMGSSADSHSDTQPDVTPVDPVPTPRRSADPAKPAPPAQQQSKAPPAVDSASLRPAVARRAQAEPARHIQWVFTLYDCDSNGFGAITRQDAATLSRSVEEALVKARFPLPQRAGAGDYKVKLTVIADVDEQPGGAAAQTTPPNATRHSTVAEGEPGTAAQTGDVIHVAGQPVRMRRPLAPVQEQRHSTTGPCAQRNGVQFARRKELCRSSSGRPSQPHRHSLQVATSAGERPYLNLADVGSCCTGGRRHCGKHCSCSPAKRRICELRKADRRLSRPAVLPQGISLDACSLETRCGTPAGRKLDANCQCSKPTKLDENKNRPSPTYLVQRWLDDFGMHKNAPALEHRAKLAKEKDGFVVKHKHVHEHHHYVHSK